MIIGTGIDITKVSRFTPWVKNEKIMRRFFHENEVEYIKSLKNGREEALAARFAAKEALGKALGTGLTGISLKNICVKKDSKGKPYIEPFEEFNSLTSDFENVKIHLSLSHEKEYAVAMVILEAAEK